jgi:hypothetical protein
VDLELDSIKKFAATLPCKVYPGPDGDAYMTRYLIKGGLGLEVGTGLSSVYLHHLHQPDYDRHLHSHPWPWATSTVLHGGYTELRATEAMLMDGFLEPYWQSYGIGDCNPFVEGDYHTIVEVERDTWTLFACGPVDRDWFFWVDGEPVNSKEYLGR